MSGNTYWQKLITIHSSHLGLHSNLFTTLYQYFSFSFIRQFYLDYRQKRILQFVNLHVLSNNYRAMHVVCPSVCLSVRLSVTLVDQDHISWKPGKLIARTSSPTSSLFVAQRSSIYSQGNMEKFGGDYRGEVGKSGVLEHKRGNISEKRVKIDEKLLWRAYSNSPTLFRMVPSPIPYTAFA